MSSTRTPTRVLHFADLVNRYDFIDNVVRNVDPGRFTMAVCTMGPPSNIEDPQYGTTPFPHWTLPPAPRWQYPLGAFRLAALLRKHRIDVVHAHHFEPCLVAAAAVTLCRGVRLVVGRHYSDAIYLHTGGWRRTVLLALESWVNRRACRVVAPSSMIGEILAQQGVAAAKIATIPYGFDTQKYGAVPSETVASYRAELGIEGKISVGTFGRLYSDKGHRFVLDALPAILEVVPSLRYFIVGEGAERTNLERQVSDLGLANAVTFLGWRHDVTELMASVDVVLQPSLQEAFSQSMVEALFAGRPLIITNVSGASEMVPDETVGIVIARADPPAIASAVITLAGDTNFRAALGEAAWIHARKHFAIPVVIPRYEQVYVDCASACP